MQRLCRNEDLRPEKTVFVSGIGCSSRFPHYMKTYGFHGIHGRALAIAWGTKAARPDLNVLTVCGDGDFLSIGQEHIGPQAKRNLDITAVVMDNGIYGLTKGQASPTTLGGVVTSTTPYGKLEDAVRPLDLYLAHNVSFIACGVSSKPKDLAKLIGQAMDHPGFSIVHVMSPCTTYNDTYEALKGNAAKGIDITHLGHSREGARWRIAQMRSPTNPATPPGIEGGIRYGAHRE